MKLTSRRICSSHSVTSQSVLIRSSFKTLPSIYPPSVVLESCLSPSEVTRELESATGIWNNAEAVRCRLDRRVLWRRVFHLSTETTESNLIWKFWHRCASRQPQSYWQPAHQHVGFSLFISKKETKIYTSFKSFACCVVLFFIHAIRLPSENKMICSTCDFTIHTYTPCSSTWNMFAKLKIVTRTA